MPDRYNDDDWEHPQRVRVHDPYYDRYSRERERGYERDAYGRRQRMEPQTFFVEVKEPYTGRTYGDGGPFSFFKFSQRELTELGTSTLITTVAFALVFTNGIYGAIEYPYLFAMFCVICAIAAAPGFIVHELAHKFLAQKYGAWSEYRMSVQGLLFGLAMAAFIGFMLLSPGAVMISGHINKEQNGKISVVGPMTNIVLGLIFLPLLIFGTGWIWIIGRFGAVINFVLAVFNMLPIRAMNLDGYKVWDWNPSVWVGTFALAIGLLAVAYQFGCQGFA